MITSLHFVYAATNTQIVKTKKQTLSFLSSNFKKAEHNISH